LTVTLHTLCLSQPFSIHHAAPTAIYTLSPTRRSSDLLSHAASGSSRRAPCGRRASGKHREATTCPNPSVTRESRGGPRSSSSNRSEEHTSELQSRFDLVCRLLLEKKKQTCEYRDSIIT